MAASESDKDELQQELRESGNRLFLQPPSSQDELLNLLDHVESYLSRVEQSPSESMRSAISPSQKALVVSKFMNHSNEDIKLAVASCISEITRITAPDAPYDDNQMKDVFQLIVSSFEKLSDKTSRSYDKRTSILETVSKVRSCVVMLDLECDSLIIEMLQHFLKEIRDYHPDIVFSSMENIMTLVLEESEDISLEILSPILATLRKDNEQEVTAIARRLGEKVLQNCANKIRPSLVQSVNSLDISLEDYIVAVANVCKETVVDDGNIVAVANVCKETVVDDGNNELNASSEQLVNESKLANGTSSNEASQVAKGATLEALSHEEVVSNPVMSNGVLLAQMNDAKALVNSNSLTSPGHSDEIKQLKSGDGPSNAVDCRLNAENIVDSEVQVEQTTEKQGIEQRPLMIAGAIEPATENATEPATENATEPATENATEPAMVNAIKPAIVTATEPAIVSATEPAIMNATQPIIVNVTEPTIVTPTEASLVSGTELSIFSPNIADKEQEKLLVSEETQCKELSSFSREDPPSEAVLPSDSKVETNVQMSSSMTLESDSAKDISPPSGNIADESRPKKAVRPKKNLIQATVSAETIAQKPSECTIDSEVKALKRSGKKVSDGISKDVTCSTRVDMSKEDSGTDSIPEAKPKPSKEVIKKMDTKEDLADECLPKKATTSKEHLVQANVSTDTFSKTLSKSTIDSTVKAHKRSSKKAPTGNLKDCTSFTPVDYTSKKNSGTESAPETKPIPTGEVSEKVYANEDLADESRPKKAGRSKESLVEATVSTDTVTKKRSEGTIDSEVKAHKRSGKKVAAEVLKEDTNSAQADTFKEDSGTDSVPEATPLKEVTKKMDKNDPIQQKKEKMLGKGKASLDKDSTKSSIKDIEDTVPLSRSATKPAKGKNLVETSVTNSKRKRTSGKETVSDNEELGENIVGKMIKVWWPDDEAFYEGRVDSWDHEGKKHKILYNDGDEEILMLKDEQWELVEGESVQDMEQGTDHVTPGASSETHRKKKSKTKSGSSSKQGKTIISPKSGGVSSNKSKVSVTKSRGKSLDDSKELKSKDQTPKGDSRSKDDVSKSSGKPKNAEASTASSKKFENDTPKTVSQIKGKSPKSGSAPSVNNSAGKVKTGSSKVKESEELVKKSPSSSKPPLDSTGKVKTGSSKAKESKYLKEKSRSSSKSPSDTKRKLPENSSKAKVSEGKSAKKRRKGW